MLSLEMYTQAGDLQVAEYCEKEHAKELGLLFLRINNGTDYTSCHSSEWMAKFQGKG